MGLGIYFGCFNINVVKIGMSSKIECYYDYREWLYRESWLKDICGGLFLLFS